jgi:hypothetical protein
MTVQKRVLAEYPYVGTVQESMVVCDNRQPDCPIVYVNDEFEKLTYLQLSRSSALRTSHAHNTQGGARTEH